jgi:O-antigen/teichoic acid export membrane protein
MLSSPFSVGSLSVAATAARLRATDEADSLSRLVGTTLVGISGLFAIAIGFGYVTAGSAVSFLGGGNESTIILSAALFALTSALLVIRGLVQGMGDFRTLAVSNLIEALGRTVLAVILLQRHVSVNGALASVTVLVGTVAALTFGLLAVKVGATVRGLDFRLVLARENNAQIFVTMGSIAVLTFLDAIVSRHFLTAHESGLYNAAALAGRALMTALAFAPSVIVPKLVSTAARGESSSTIVRQTAMFLFGICAPAVAIFFLMPSLVIRIIAGPEFLQAASLVGRYGLAAAALASANIVCSLRIGRDDFRMTPFVAATTACEAVAFVFFHMSAEMLVAVVVLGHSATFIATLVPRRLRISAMSLRSDSPIR